MRRANRQVPDVRLQAASGRTAAARRRLAARPGAIAATGRGGIAAIALAVAALAAITLVLGGGPAAGRPLPSLARYARFSDALIRVRPEGAPAIPGFLVATAGYAVSVWPGAKPGASAQVQLANGELRRGVVVLAEEALVVLQVAGEPGELFASLPLALKARPDPSAWLVGLCGTDEVSPVVGGTRGLDGQGRWRLDLPCGPGAPVLDQSGRAVAVVIAAAGRRASFGVPVTRVRALMAPLAAPRAPPAEPPATAPGGAAP